MKTMATVFINYQRIGLVALTIKFTLELYLYLLKEDSSQIQNLIITTINIITLIVFKYATGFLIKKRKWKYIEYALTVVLLAWITFHFYAHQGTIDTRHPNPTHKLPTHLVITQFLVIIIATNMLSRLFLKVLVYFFYYFLAIIFTNDFEHQNYVLTLIGFTVMILLVCH